MNTDFNRVLPLGGAVLMAGSVAIWCLFFWWLAGGVALCLFFWFLLTLI